MKKMFLVFLTVATATVVSAQVKFGVKAGYNLATLTTSGDASGMGISSKSDFSGGLFASVPLFSSCTLQPEVLYSGQGAEGKDGIIDVKLNYSYLNVPVLFKYQHASGLFAETGPQVGFLLSAKLKEAGQTSDAKDGTESVDFSWAFGVGYMISKINLGIDARYNLGLTDINKDATNGSIKNSVFQFGLFYQFKSL